MSASLAAPDSANPRLFSNQLIDRARPSWRMGASDSGAMAGVEGTKWWMLLGNASVLEIVFYIRAGKTNSEFVEPTVRLDGNRQRLKFKQTVRE